MLIVLIEAPESWR